MNYYIGIDLGGTNIKAGIVDENGKKFPTYSQKTCCADGVEGVAKDMAEAARGALEIAGVTLDDIVDVGIGAPGTVDGETGNIIYANNLGFFNAPLGSLVSKEIGKPVRIANDANAAAYGEYIAGAGKNSKSMVMITLGTGVGGGVIIDGKMLTGFNGAGGELGHMVIKAGGRKCTCGRKGCFEAYSSANALKARAKDAMELDTESLLWEHCDGNADNMTGEIPFDAMREGDETAREVVEEYLRYLSIGLTNIVNIFQPEILCIGGGVCHEGDALINPIIKRIAREGYSRYCENKPKLVLAELGNNAGIIGAALMK